MANEKHDPWALLREARDFVERAAHILEDDGYYADAQANIGRIDAALAEHDAREADFRRERDDAVLAAIVARGG